MRISDWSSDVCSSDLLDPLGLCADLDRMAFEPGPGEIVLDAPAFLALVLIVAAAADAQDVAAHDHARLRVGRRRARIGEPKSVAAFDRRGRPFAIGRAHVCTPVTNPQTVCRLLLGTKKNHSRSR